MCVCVCEREYYVIIHNNKLCDALHLTTSKLVFVYDYTLDDFTITKHVTNRS